MARPSEDSVKKLPHHHQLQLCLSRPKYRQGRKLTAVRVYTVNDESKYLIVNGVSAVNISEELEALCQRYGSLENINLLPDYPHEDYVEVYLVKYRVLKNARFAKRQLDGKSFYGQVLHVCYAPELETVEETREKLQERRKSIAALTRHQQHPTALRGIQKRRVMPPAAVRYMTQLRPELMEENMNRLHHQVEDCPASNSRVGHQQQQTGDGGDSQDAPHTMESYSGNITVDDLKKSSEKRTSELHITTQEECDNTVGNKDKRSSESCVTTKKKIRLFGKKDLLSYKQD